jgi:hypothetical protein
MVRCPSQDRNVAVPVAVNRAMMPVVAVFYNRSLNIMTRFIIAAVFTKVSVIRLIPIIPVVAGRVAVFVPLT